VNYLVSNCVLLFSVLLLRFVCHVFASELGDDQSRYLSMSVDDRCKEEIADARLTVQEISGVVDEDAQCLSAVLCSLCEAE